MNASDDDSRPYRPGVGALLLNDGGLVWIGERRRRVGQQLDFPWQLPQGGLDPGEDPRAAVLRELEEETGTRAAEIIAESDDWLTYDLPRDVRNKVWKGRFRGQRQKWFCGLFLGADREIDLETPDPEFSAWKWVPVPETVPLIVPFKRSLYAEVIAHFRPWWAPRPL